MCGELQVHDEHVFSESVQNMLRAAIGNTLRYDSTPRVLLTTVPDEAHTLGLLMAEAIMTAEGANCVSLGSRTPLSDIRRAVVEGHFDAVALSFSASINSRQAVDSLNALRSLLPATVALWAGGAGIRQPQRLNAGIVLVQSIADTARVVREWRHQHTPHAMH